MNNQVIPFAINFGEASEDTQQLLRQYREDLFDDATTVSTTGTHEDTATDEG